MKKGIFSVALLLATTAAFAVPAKPGLWRTVKTTDGRELRVELRGDEYGHYWQTAGGERLEEDASTGLFKKADMSLLTREAAERRARMAQTGPRKSAAAGTQKVSYTGKKKGLVILVNFKDTKFKKADTPELYNQILNTIGYNNPDLGFKGSVKDYFLAQSSGQMEFDFDIAGPVTMPYSYKYYGMNQNGKDVDSRVGDMVVKACEGVDDEVDFSKYDWNGDGVVEQVFILFAGRGEASTPSDPFLIWPHMYSVYYATGKVLKLDGVTIDTYACSNELNSKGKIDGIGTFCHEFSHCLGLPDFYDTYDSYTGAYGTGSWDIMCGGSYNGDSFSPANYTSYERMFAGWLTPVELNKDTTVTAMQPLSDKHQEAYIIYNDNNRDEYYLLENRQKLGWDENLPGAGLMITHVDYDKNVWDLNMPNSPQGQKAARVPNPHEHYSMFSASNRKGGYDSYGYPIEADAYPYGGNDSLTNSSLPAAGLFNANTDGTLLMNKPLTAIRQNADGTVAFSFANDNRQDNDYDVPAGYLFYESFDKCKGKGGNDGLFAGSTVGKGTFAGNTDNEGWQSEQAHAASACAMFGSSLVPGQVTLPALTLNGESRLLFKAAPYTGDGNELSLTIRGGGTSLTDSTLTMTEGRWTLFDIPFTATGSVEISLGAPGRFFLDKVCVVTGQSAGITAVPQVRKGNGLVYTLDGRCLGPWTSQLKKGIYILNGKKIIKY